MSPKNDENDEKTNLAVMAQQMTHVCKQVNDLHIGMYGLPGEPESGMLFRMQKIEVEANAKKSLRAEIVAWLAIAISTILGIISTFFSNRY